MTATPLSLALHSPRRGCRIAHGAPMLPPYKFRVDDNHCWLWLGATIVNRSGDLYGVCKIKQVQHLVHRVMYEEYHGPIPEGYDVHHVCDVTLCGNPAHLQSVIAVGNRVMMTRKRKGRKQ
ncbi:hypothetical protein LCGC14_2655680 [marine sediment metagenome]|uniref:HNH nuclease domain-containing protein n=1 Tax=marine sediment metagenome TaxID=412755 RepID=A0A0F9CKH4_9ZZZZ